MRAILRHLLPMAFGLWVGTAAAAEPYGLNIGTGGVTGVYYQVGAAICRLLREHPPRHPVDCTVQATAGAVRNLIDIRYGAAAMALTQADSLFYAMRGEGPFVTAGPDRRTRAMFTLLTETVNVLTREDEPAERIADLRGRRVNIGPPGSGTAVTFRRLIDERGWTRSDFAGFTDYRSALQAEALCGERTDAMVFVAANPSPEMQDATFACRARLVPIADEFARAMTGRYPYYVPAVIPAATYPNNPSPVATIGIRATLVAARETPEEVVHEVTQAVLDHLDEFRTLHLAFKDVRLEDITRHCVFAPLHPGTARYLRERGLTIEVCREPLASAAG
jgi:uncharacterized protein